MRDKYHLYNINVDGNIVGYYETFTHLEVQGDDYSCLLIFYVKNLKNKQPKPRNLT
jgi:hypothetical protein